MRHHIVLMGASNLAMAFPTVVADLVERSAGEPLVIYAARACGRSYGTDAGIAGFKFPGLTECGLIERLETELERGPVASCAALLTDVGNDIPYGHPPERIAGWVDGILERLEPLSVRFAVTSLPVESVCRISPRRFRVLRPVFFPFHPVTHETLNRHLREVQAALLEISEKRALAVLETRPEWYGFDHFHLRRRQRGSTFARWLDAVLPWARPDPPAKVGPLLATSRWGLRYRQPATYSWLGIRRSSPQGEGLEIAPNVRLLCF